MIIPTNVIVATAEIISLCLMKKFFNFAIYHTYVQKLKVLSKEKILIKWIFVYIRQFVKGFSGPFNQVYAFYF